MLQWWANCGAEIQLFAAAGVGAIVGAIFCWFGEVLAPDDLIQKYKCGCGIWVKINNY